MSGIKQFIITSIILTVATSVGWWAASLSSDEDTPIKTHDFRADAGQILVERLAENEYLFPFIFMAMSDGAISEDEFYSIAEIDALVTVEFMHHGYRIKGFGEN